jgi:hypothetical protein
MMPIRKLKITHFRGLDNQQIDFQGKALNAIIGQNASMKTTILGIISSSFSLKSSVMNEDKTIDGDNYGIQLQERFKFSSEFDHPGEHSWTLTMHPSIYKGDYSIKSYRRPNGGIRFWKVGARKKGDTLLQCPVIYLSLRRLLPIGEESKLSLSDIDLSADEVQFYKNWHNQILVSTDNLVGIYQLNSKDKITVTPSADYYDSTGVSSGQDDIGKVITAVLSMKRLKEKYRDAYKGGIICIDELESTLYPASQVKLVHFLKQMSYQYSIQFFFTTHSMDIIRTLYQKEFSNYVSITYAKKVGKEVNVFQNVPLQSIQDDLHIKINGLKKREKVHVYCEDVVGMEFTKYLLTHHGIKYTDKFIFENENGSNLGWPNYENFLRKKIPEFMYSVIILDGDVKQDANAFRKFKRYKNVVYLPTISYPEFDVYDCLSKLEDNDKFWDNSLGGYSKQACFKDYLNDDLSEAQIKKWFSEQKNQYGKGYNKILNKTFENRGESCEQFISDFKKAFNFSKEHLI